jgi:hypothetical protein
LYRPANAVLRLAYGREDLTPPRYDLALLAPQVLGVAASEVTAAATSATVTKERTLVLASPAVFWSVLGVAVVVLLGFVVKLMRNVETPAV